MLNVSRTKPTSGQFIEMWEYNGQVWSQNYKWNDGTLYSFSYESDGWVIDHNTLTGNDITNVQYITVK